MEDDMTEAKPLQLVLPSLMAPPGLRELAHVEVGGVPWCEYHLDHDTMALLVDDYGDQTKGGATYMPVCTHPTHARAAMFAELLQGRGLAAAVVAGHCPVWARERDCLDD
jgi:hypothetical protein